MKIGAYYYPEQWPREQWERDFDNIQKLGLQIVHMAEFAWFALEPKPGDIQLDWLSDCVEMAAKRKLDVILCTPSAAPPIWLSQQHPETLPIENGFVRQHGGRRHYSPTSPALREATTRIVSAMAERFGNHPSIIGWQIDNEYGGTFSTNDHTQASFRKWLQQKYGSIEGLNKAWGNQFWNTYYTSFDQILLPAGRDPLYANPHHHLDASRFWSWAMADFNRIQAKILKPKIGKRFITTNFMTLHLDANPGDFAEDLTLFSWDSYPVTGWDKNPTDESFRLADPDSIALMHDFMASFNGRLGLMELQPGQVNWSGVPVLVYPGAIRLWIWTAFAHGSEFVTTYRYRRPLFGIELFHHGLTEPDGVTPSPGGKQFAQVCDEMKKLDLASIPPLGDEPLDPDSTVGLVLDFEQIWYYVTLPQSKKWNQAALLNMWYGAIARLGLRVRILHPNRPWPSGLKFIVVPAVQMLDDALIQRFNEFTAGGGNLLFTCRTGLMDRNGQLWEGPLAQPILPMIGANITDYDTLPDDLLGKIDFNGKKYDWNIWGDLIQPNQGTEVLAKYADQFYAGTAAATRHRHNKGTVTYCGVYAKQDFFGALFAKVSADAGLKTSELPKRVHIFQRGPYKIALNYQDKPVRTPAPADAKFIIGGPRLEAAGVAIWQA